MTDDERLKPSTSATDETEQAQGGKALKYILLTALGVAIGVFIVAVVLIFLFDA